MAPDITFNDMAYDIKMTIFISTSHDMRYDVMGFTLASVWVLWRITWSTILGATQKCKQGMANQYLVEIIRKDRKLPYLNLVHGSVYSFLKLRPIVIENEIVAGIISSLWQCFLSSLYTPIRQDDKVLFLLCCGSTIHSLLNVLRFLKYWWVQNMLSFFYILIVIFLEFSMSLRHQVKLFFGDVFSRK